MLFQFLSFLQAYMLHGEGKALEMLSDHSEKKFLRNLLTALQEQAQELDGGKRRGGSKGQGRGGGGGPSKGQVGFMIPLCTGGMTG